METMTTSIILPFLVFFPFLGAVISYIIGRSNKGARDIWCWMARRRWNLTIFILFPCIITAVRAEVSCLLPGRCVMMENWSFAWHIQLPSFGCSLFCLMPTGDILADGAACIFIAAKRL